jgi:hypothetical protein
MREPTTLAPGDVTAGDLRVVKRLGDEADALYVVEQMGSGVQRVLKQMRAELVKDEDVRRRFITEARVLSSSQGEGAVTVIAAGVDAESGAPWLLMNVVEGATPAEYSAAAYAELERLLAAAIAGRAESSGASGEAGPVKIPVWNTPAPPAGGWGPQQGYGGHGALPVNSMAGEGARGRRRFPALTIVGLALGLLLLFNLGGASLFVLASNYERVKAADVAKIFIALAAAGLSLADALRAALRGSVPKAVQMALFIGLGVAAIVAYFNAFQFAYPKYYHRWEQYHSYVGAKYFPELGYDGLYRCAVVAQDELGDVSFTRDTGVTARVDMSAEARKPDKRIRDVGGNNLLIPASSVLENPEACKGRFSPARWERFKADVKFFRTESDKQYWEDMQKDHGYGMSPVWTIGGRLFGELHAASVGYMQFLAVLDLGYLLATFAALWWAFGWRVSAAAAIFWGCQASAPFFWTGGAFLRQDWLFYLVLSVCLIRKRHFKLAGASMVYSSLLSVFPAYALLGPAIFGATWFFRKRRLAKSHKQVLIGGAIAAATLIPLSMVVAGPTAFKAYFEQRAVDEATPLTNHMGLGALVAHDLSSGPGSGRMQYAKDTRLLDPFSSWKRMRNERRASLSWLEYGVIGLAVGAFVGVARRLRTLWIAGCLGQVFIVLMGLLTCFHYTFLILSAPLTRARRWLEVILFSFAALTQLVWIGFVWNDDRYAALSAVSLLFCFAMLAAFVGRRRTAAALGRREIQGEAFGRSRDAGDRL